MAKGSKEGACSSHTDSAKANCLKHNRREQVPGYVNPHLSVNNRTVFEADCIRGRKSITPLVHQAEKLYTLKTGQKVQKSFAAFRESVLVVREGVTDEQLQNFIREAEALTGWKAIGCWLHLDEGHAKSKYIDGQDGFALNAHAHVLWDCQDHTTGKSIKCKRSHLSQMQDILAAATGMERGNKASETGRTHRSALQQRIDAQEARIAQLERISKTKDDEIAAKDATIEEQERLLDDITREIDKLSRSKAVKKAAIAKLEEMAVRAKAAGVAAVESGKAVGDWVKGKLNLSDKDDVIKAQAAQIATMTEEIGKAKAREAAALQKAAEAFEKGKQAAYDEVFEAGRWDATQSTKEVHDLTSIQRHLQEDQKALKEERAASTRWYEAYRELKREQEQTRGMHRRP